MNIKENKLVKYLIEAKSELQRVAWPSRKETITFTLVVIGVSVGAASFLAAVDFGLTKAFEALILTR